MELHKFHSINDIRIPIKISIGVTGHRNLSNEDVVRNSIRNVFGTIGNRFDSILKKSPHFFSIISPLAEGTDRIAVEEIFKIEKSSKYEKTSLEVILPFCEEDYLNDFKDNKSKTEFKQLLNLADSVKLINKTKSRVEAYYHSGICTVDNSDILIAVWNGKAAAGLGGTAEIVNYARERNKWIFWIDSETGSIKEEGNPEKLFEYLEVYNSESLDIKQIEKELEDTYNFLVDKFDQTKLSTIYLEPVTHNLLPQFVRADILAQKYQKLYNSVGNSIYILAAGAVATVTIQILFFPSLPQLIWLEFVGISLILILLIISNIQDWHRKWIDYRFLSERLRVSLYLFVANIQTETQKLSDYTLPTGNWIFRAYSTICKDINQNEKKIPFNLYKRFLIEALFNDQILYYNKSALNNKRNHDLFTHIGEIFFILTLLAAAIHAMEIDIFKSHQILSATAIILPTIAAAMTGIRNNHEYIRNAKRYEQMSIQLTELKKRLEEVQDMESLVSILDNTNQTIFREHQDWRFVVKFNKLEPP